MTVSILTAMLFAGTAAAATYTVAKNESRDIYQVAVGSQNYNVAGVQSNSDSSKLSHTTDTSTRKITITGREVGSVTLVISYYNSYGGTSETSVTVDITDSGTGSTRQVNLPSLNDYYTSPEKFSSIWDVTMADTTVATYSHSDGNNIIVTGRKAGTTTLTFWGRLTDGTTNRYTFNINVVTGTSGSSGTVSLKAGETHYITPETTTFYIAGNNPTNVATMSKTADNRILITALSVGSTSLSYSYQRDGNLYNVTVPVTVTSGTGTNPTSNTISLAVGQNYTQNYTTVGISSNSNPSAATAKIESVSGGQQAVITGVSAGSTTITLVYTSASGSGSVTLTVNVAGGSGNTGVNSETSGIYFKSASVSIPTAKKYRISGIKLNGVTAKAADLLWISTDTTIVAVGSTTGIFQGKKSGSAKMIAVDKDGKYVNSITVTVK